MKDSDDSIEEVDNKARSSSGKSRPPSPRSRRVMREQNDFVMEWNKWHKRHPFDAPFPHEDEALARYMSNRKRFEERMVREMNRLHSSSPRARRPRESSKDRRADAHAHDPRKRSADQPAESPTKKQC